MKKRHKKRHKHKHGKSIVSPTPDDLTLNPPTSDTISESHFKKPFLDVEALGLVDPLGESCEYK